MIKDSNIASLRRLILYVWVVALVLAIWPYTANPVKPVKDLVTAVAILLLAATMVAWPERKGDESAWRRLAVVPLIGLWIAWSAISALMSEFIVAGLDEVRVFFVWFIVALFASRLFREPRHVKTLFLVICFAVIASNLYGFVQYMGWDPFPWVTRDIEEYRGLPSTYGNPNFAGHTLLLAIVIGLGLGSLKGARWAWVLVLFPAAHLYETHMRGAQVGLLAALLLFICALICGAKFRASPGKKAVAAVLMTLGAGVVGVMLLLFMTYARTGLYFPTDGSLILRYNGYYGAAQMVTDQPVFGVGPGNYSRKNIPYWTPYEQRWFASEQKRNMHVHNDLLETATETGVPGLAFHVALLVALVMKSLMLAYSEKDVEKRRIGYTLAALFTGFAVDGLFGFNLRVPVSGALFFLMAGVLDGITQPKPNPVSAVPAGLKKNTKRAKKVQPEAARAPRVLFAMALLVGATVCVFWAVIVFYGEVLYQRAQGARLFADNTTMSAHRQQALQDAQSLATRGRRFVFWESRHSDLLGHIAMRRGDLNGAIISYQRAFRHDPHHPHIPVNIARAYLSSGLHAAREGDGANYDQAAGAFHEAFQWASQGEQYCPVSPHVQDVLWRIFRAKAILAEQRNEDAIPYWREVERRIVASLDYGPQDISSANRTLAHAYFKTNRVAESLALFQQSMPDTPDSAGVWNIFETASNETNEYGPLAAALAETFITLRNEETLPQETFIDIVRRLVRCHHEYLNNPAEAMYWVQLGLDRIAEPPELWAMLAGLAAHTQQLEAVCERARPYEQVSREDSVMPQFIALLCLEEKGVQELSKASHALARITLQKGGQPAARDMGGAADFLSAWLDTLAPGAVREAEIKANIATVYLEAARWSEAERYFAEAIAELPADSRARLMAARARALSNLDRHQEGLALARHAARTAPSDPMVQLTLARFLRDTGRREEAAFSYQAAINALPEQSSARIQAQTEMDALDQQETVEQPDRDF